MSPFEIDDVLKTFRIIVDNREQSTKKAKARYKAMEAEIERATLDFGDYCWQVSNKGVSYYDTASRITPVCCIERKMSLDELAMCLTRDRDRFRREVERAIAYKSIIYLLVENGSWEGIRAHRYRSKFHPNAFLASLTAWMIRYNMPVIFCKAETSGALIREILYRDVKERLERGDFDGCKN